MKKFRNYFLLAVGIFLSMVAFTACGDDDEPDVESADIVGTWESVRGKEWAKLNGEILTNWEGVIKGFTVEFKSDGTCVMKFQEDEYDEEEAESSRWKIQGDQLILIYEDGEEVSHTINSLTRTQLTISAYEKYEVDEGTYEYYDETSFRRVGSK